MHTIQVYAAIEINIKHFHANNADFFSKGIVLHDIHFKIIRCLVGFIWH